MQCHVSLNCPVCASELHQHNHTFTCVNAHSFDIAREGYLNLLLKKPAGDTKEMLAARRTFLARGHYQVLSDTLNTLVSTFLQQATLDVSDTPPAILDAGCGEGYYLGRLQRSLTNQDCSARTVGLDLSKEGIKMAAKQYKEACFIVGNLKDRLVFADHTFHVVLNIFAPRNIDEFARVLTPNGLLLIVIPGEGHLAQLRKELHLLGIEEHKEDKVRAQCAPHFAFVGATSLKYSVTLSEVEVIQLVQMTPTQWHLSPHHRPSLPTNETHTTQVEFVCLAFNKRARVEACYEQAP